MYANDQLEYVHMSLLQLLTLLPGPHRILCHFFYLCVESVEKTLFSFLWHAGTGVFFSPCHESRAIALWILGALRFLKPQMRWGQAPTASKSPLSLGDDFVAGQRRNLDGGSCIVWALTPCEAWVGRVCQREPGSLITGSGSEQPACVTVVIYTEQLSARGRD